MKKLVIGCLLSSLSLITYAQTCPAVSEILVKHGKNYDVVAPEGWTVVVSEKSPKEKQLVFRVAGWGNHERLYDNVRCHYYHNVSEEHVELQTADLIEESRVASHPEWTNDNLYHMCISGSDKVSDCPFN